jgi:phospholipid/cholesterol/gamma-HCH transport system substrate-binding protein
MDHHPVRDFIVGLFVIAGLAALGYLSLSIGGLTFNKTGGFEVYALFDEVADLKPRAPVMIAGVKVGEITSITLNQKTYQARVDMDLRPGLKLDTETSAAIYTEGLLGDRYVALEPGASPDELKPGDRIERTASGMVLEKLVGHVLANIGGSDKGSVGDSKGNPSTAPAPGPAAPRN